MMTFTLQIKLHRTVDDSKQPWTSC